MKTSFFLLQLKTTANSLTCNKQYSTGTVRSMTTTTCESFGEESLKVSLINKHSLSTRTSSKVSPK